MIKHIFAVLILLIEISTVTSAQTDTIQVILKDSISNEATNSSIFFEDDLEDELDYLSNELLQQYDSILAKDTMYFRFFVEGGGDS